MQNEVTIEDFLNACEDILSRTQNDSKDPKKLKNILQELEIILKDKWSEAIIQLNDTDLSDHRRNQIKNINLEKEKLIVKKQRNMDYD